MAIFKTRKVEKKGGAGPRKAPWGERTHKITGRDVGVKVDREGNVADTVTWAMPADFAYSDPKACEWGKQKSDAGRQSKVDRGKCWVQLAIVEGRPYLRVCRKNNEASALVPVSSPTEARIRARELCDAYEKSKGDWSKFKKSLPRTYKIGSAPAPRSPARKGKYCVVGRNRKELRCFATKAAADKYRKRRCAKRGNSCSLKVRSR